MKKTSAKTTRRIFSVTELTKEIKENIENSFPFVWVAGEISNFHIPNSRHYYFTLKDKNAQIGAVMFRGQNRHLTFAVEDGMAVIAMGRINVYEAKGTYQIIIEHLEPSGTGALQLAFEKLKERLATEGLFDEKHKKALPFLPRIIAIVTSPTGAVIRDILQVIDRRFCNLNMQIAPVKVQGIGASEEISNAIDMLNKRAEADIIVIARGGGSLEDLQAFNSETVARAVFASHIPVVSAVGHETDFTICDFVADLRAPTPSAAAEIITPEKKVLIQLGEQTRKRLIRAIEQHISGLKHKGNELVQHLISPQKRLENARLRLDDIWERLVRAQLIYFKSAREDFRRIKERLFLFSPKKCTHILKVLLENINRALNCAMQYQLDSKRNAFHISLGRINALNPLSVLGRGYSVTTDKKRLSIIKDVAQVEVGQKVYVTFWRGEMACRVEEKGEKWQNKLLKIP